MDGEARLDGVGQQGFWGVTFEQRSEGSEGTNNVPVEEHSRLKDLQVQNPRGGNELVCGW